MIKIKLFTLYVVSVLYMAPVLSVSSISSVHPITSFDSNLENHIVDEVPYVGQTTNFYCAFASITMIIQYYGFNASLHEILHNLGLGYSLLYQHYIAPARIPIGGSGLCGVLSNMRFLASLYNLSYNVTSTYNEDMCTDFCWDEYWSKVRENISDDVPLMTSVDPYSLPYLSRYLNITPSNETHGGHAVVIVGFNESNETVCLNDPAPGLYNDDINGTYVFVSKKIFKNAVKNTTGVKYGIWAFNKKSDFIPLIPKERFKIAYQQNIKRMKGCLDAYPEYYNGIFSPSLGIKCLKAFKKDLRSGMAHRLFTLNIYKKIDDTELEFLYDLIVIEKHNVSQYLLNNKNLSNVCQHDGLLLKKEVNCWKNMTQLVLEFNNISKNNNFLTTLIKTIPVTIKMKKTLNEIIFIEKEIITGPQPVSS